MELRYCENCGDILPEVSAEQSADVNFLCPECGGFAPVQELGATEEDGSPLSLDTSLEKGKLDLFSSGTIELNIAKVRKQAESESPLQLVEDRLSSEQKNSGEGLILEESAASAPSVDSGEGPLTLVEDSPEDSSARILFSCVHCSKRLSIQSVTRNSRLTCPYCTRYVYVTPDDDFLGNPPSSIKGSGSSVIDNIAASSVARVDDREASELHAASEQPSKLDSLAVSAIVEIVPSVQDLGDKRKYNPNAVVARVEKSVSQRKNLGSARIMRPAGAERDGPLPAYKSEDATATETEVVDPDGETQFLKPLQKPQDPPSHVESESDLSKPAAQPVHDEEDTRAFDPSEISPPTRIDPRAATEKDSRILEAAQSMRGGTTGSSPELGPASSVACAKPSSAPKLSPDAVRSPGSLIGSGGARFERTSGKSPSSRRWGEAPKKDSSSSTSSAVPESLPRPLPKPEHYELAESVGRRRWMQLWTSLFVASSLLAPFFAISAFQSLQDSRIERARVEHRPVGDPFSELGKIGARGLEKLIGTSDDEL